MREIKKTLSNQEKIFSFEVKYDQLRALIETLNHDLFEAEMSPRVRALLALAENILQEMELIFNH